MFGLSTKERSDINAISFTKSVPQVVAIVEREPQPLSQEPMPTAMLEPPKIMVPEPQAAQSNVETLAEYAEVAALVGVNVPALEIEAFLAVLVKLDFPIYSLQAVVTYMDDKAKREGQGWGWSWQPLRKKDVLAHSFGRAAEWRRAIRVASGERINEHVSASDYHAGVTEDPRLYGHIVPLHALKRIAAIEKEYTKPVHFVVTDYAPQPQFRADPFLMAMIPNPQLGAGVGRFVIDFWDEPGFGIDKMLK